MKLSEFIAIPEDQRVDFYRGIEVDVVDLTPPKGVRSIGLLCQHNNGELTADLIDVALSYARSGVEVLIEVPAEQSCPEPKYLVAVAANAGFSISLLPPQSQGEEAAGAYSLRLLEFIDAYMSHPNMPHAVYPISSYLEYMYLECVKDVSAYRPTDPYVIDVFDSAVTSVFADKIKHDMREKIHASFGGENEFVNFAKAIIYKVNERIMRNAQTLSSQRREAPAS